MVIFVHEERAYLSWLAHHRHGFVLDMFKKPTKKAPQLHRASCEAIRSAKGKRTHWTTGRHYKACALEIEELVAWAETEADREPVPCEICRPTDESAAATPPKRHLTRLGKDIVDYVVDAAVVCLDQERSYRLTVGQVGRYLGKSPAQLREPLLRLVEDGYLRVEGTLDSSRQVSGRRKILPTADALRTLPFFQHMPSRKVKAELEHLSEEDAQ